VDIKFPLNDVIKTYKIMVSLVFAM